MRGTALVDCSEHHRWIDDCGRGWARKLVTVILALNLDVTFSPPFLNFDISLASFDRERPALLRLYLIQNAIFFNLNNVLFVLHMNRINPASASRYKILSGGDLRLFRFR